MGWCACCATSGRCRASSGGGVGGWSASASPPFTRSQPRSRKAFPPCFVAVCGWVVCAKNWQLRTLLEVVLPLRTYTIEGVLELIAWVQQRNYQAYRAHRARRQEDG